jgi:hypothetical protein
MFKQPSVRSESDIAYLLLWFLAGLVVDVISAGMASTHLIKDFRSMAAQRYDKPT